MTQLILDIEEHGIALPESQKGEYTAYLDDGYEDVEMVTRRLVREFRGSVWVVEYQYGFFDADMKDRVIAACRKGKRTPIICDFLPPDSDGTLNRSLFWVTSFNSPKFMWSTKLIGTGEKPVPLWADFSLTLREVEPSD